MRVWKRFTGVVVALLLCCILAGCNTFKGMGKDIEGAGQSLQKASDKAKDALQK